MVSMLTARALTIGYPGTVIGQSIDLALRAGSLTCLLGANGSGKTTLFKTLLGLIPRLGGHVAIDGEDILDLDRARLARALAYVPQAHMPAFPYTVFDLVLMGRTAHHGLFASPSAADRAVAAAALAELGLADLGDRSAMALSGGQRQLVTIARALAQESRFIVLDEPTASLDYGNQLLVLGQIRALVGAGRGIIMSTHDPDHALALADRVLAIQAGAIIADGAPDDVIDAALLSRLYGAEIAVATLADGRRITVPAATGQLGRFKTTSRCLPMS